VRVIDVQRIFMNADFNERDEMVFYFYDNHCLREAVTSIIYNIMCMFDALHVPTHYPTHSFSIRVIFFSQLYNSFSGKARNNSFDIIIKIIGKKIRT